MTICEFLHCSFSELSSRCSSLVDRLLILEYLKVKPQREKEAFEREQGPPPSKSTMPRRPS